LVGYSGGLIGPVGMQFDFAGSMDGTPVFIGCSDVDAHIPVGRVKESAEVMSGLGADVDLRIYPGMGHTVNQDEITAVQAILAPLSSAD
jgi:predicted esterase